MMSEYIKREDAIKAFSNVLDEDFWGVSEETPRMRIADIPSADVVPYYDYRELKKKYDKLEEDYDDLTEFHTGAMMYLTEVVKCERCKLHNGHRCEKYGAVVKPSDYCSYGERKDGDNGA